MLVELDQIEPLLRCPRTRGMMARDGATLRCVDDADCVYQAVNGAPVLVDFSRSILSFDEVMESEGASPVKRRALDRLKQPIKRILSPVKGSTQRNIDRLIACLSHKRSPLVLVIGGGTVGQGVNALYAHEDLRVTAFDIYFSPNVQFIADAHNIPMRDGSVDAVVIQAVLEHVLDPQQVVEEIWRVLAPDGLVYAETPFLQHVHEGAYDFTRFTESGHRFLFRRFELIDSGVSGGPGTQLIWSIDYFSRAVFRSRLVGKAFKFAFSWLRLFDAAVPDSYASDAASGVYFLGRRSSRTVSPREMVAFYPGAQVAAQSGAST